MNDWLPMQNIHWQFNLNGAPWWGGQFERLIGVMKQNMYKAIENGHLRCHKLEEVILDVETTLNDRPQIPKEELTNVEDYDLRKRAKYLRKCKDVLWKRWTTKYLKALRERYNLNHQTEEATLKEGDVILIKGERRKRQMEVGVVERLIQGRDGVIRGAQLRAGKTHPERLLQLLYPLELACDRSERRRGGTLRADAGEF